MHPGLFSEGNNCLLEPGWHFVCPPPGTADQMLIPCLTAAGCRFLSCMPLSGPSCVCDFLLLSSSQRSACARSHRAAEWLPEWGPAEPWTTKKGFPDTSTRCRIAAPWVAPGATDWSEGHALPLSEESRSDCNVWGSPVPAEPIGYAQLGHQPEGRNHMVCGMFLHVYPGPFKPH